MSPSRLFFNTPTHTHAHGCQLPHWEWGSQGDSCRHRLACRRDAHDRARGPANRRAAERRQRGGAMGGARAGTARRAARRAAATAPPWARTLPGGLANRSAPAACRLRKPRWRRPLHRAAPPQPQPPSPLSPPLSPPRQPHLHPLPPPPPPPPSSPCVMRLLSYSFMRFFSSFCKPRADGGVRC